VLVVLVGALEAGEPGDVRVDGGLLQHERVTGSEGLHLSEGQGLVADAVDVAVGQVAAVTWAMNAAFRSRVCHM
jgi:hypothetical protein